MNRFVRIALFGLMLLACASLVAWRPRHEAAAFEWKLRGFPVPAVPSDNPMSLEKVELGRRLFYDRRLSGNETQACASCHQQAVAFTDRRAHAIGSTGAVHRRSSMSLVNVAYASRLTWANPMLDRLEDQALLPMFGNEPIELGLTTAEMLTDRLKKVTDYRERFARSFPDEPMPIVIANVVKAIAAFERTIISDDSPYDRFTRGDATALSAEAQRGMALFNSERLECFHCHGGFNFTDSVNHTGLREPERAFHNTALYNIDGKGGYPVSDRGLFDLTWRAADMGKFRAPTLRNIAVTAPYMHDGSIATLDEAVAHYAHGGRQIDAGPAAGDGSKNPHKEAFMVGFTLTDDERRDVVAFLESLTDQTLLTDPRLSDPFASGGDGEAK